MQPAFRHRLRLALGFALAMAAPAAMAKDSAKNGKDPKADADTQRAIDSLSLVVPVVREGRLVNYLFVGVRVTLAEKVDLWKARERTHFLRDRLVKAAHRADLTKPDNPMALDEAKAIAAFKAAAADALGAQAIASVQILATDSLRRR